MTNYKSTSIAQAVTSMICALAVSTFFLASAADTGRPGTPVAAARIA